MRREAAAAPAALLRAAGAVVPPLPGPFRTLCTVAGAEVHRVAPADVGAPDLPPPAAAALLLCLLTPWCWTPRCGSATTPTRPRI